MTVTAKRRVHYRFNPVKNQWEQKNNDKEWKPSVWLKEITKQNGILTINNLSKTQAAQNIKMTIHEYP